MPLSEYIADYDFARQCLADDNIELFTEKYGDYIKKIISKIIDNKMYSELNDIYHEILIYLFYTKKKGLKNYEGRAKLTTWLYTIVSRRTIEFNRKIKKHYESDPIEEMSDASHEPEDDTRRIVSEALDLLYKWDFEKAKLFVKIYIEGLTLEQLSIIFNKPRSSIHYYIKQARERFKIIFRNLNE